MFEYYDGYEIDGSDTSYNIITPEIEKLKEVVNYYLNLKIIRKDIPIKILSINRKRKGELYQKEYYQHELDQFWEDILNEKIKSVQIGYQYVNPYNLYPEVKRELIDFLHKDYGVKINDLKHPVFSINHHVDGNLTLYFKDTKDTKGYPYSSDLICGNGYYERHKNTIKSFIENWCALGCAYEIKYYGLKKIAHRFPEFEIDIKDCVPILCWYELNMNDYLKEEIDLESRDMYVTVQRILDHEKIQLQERNNMTHNRNGINKKKYYEFKYESVIYKDGEEFVYGMANSQYDRLIDLHEKYNDKTLKGYIEYVKQLSKMTLLDDKEFIYESTLGIVIDKEGKKYYGKIIFKRNCKSKVTICLVIPHEIRHYVEKILGLDR